jgi:hypothetical protein
VDSQPQSAAAQRVISFSRTAGVDVRLVGAPEFELEEVS